jgi:hypothetical protein
MAPSYVSRYGYGGGTLPQKVRSDTIALYVIDRGEAFVIRSVGASKTSPTDATAKVYPITSS